MTDLISREAAIAVIESLAPEWARKGPLAEFNQVTIKRVREALTNMPSEALREGDNLYIGRPQPEPPFTVTLDTKKLA